MYWLKDMVYVELGIYFAHGFMYLNIHLPKFAYHVLGFQVSSLFSRFFPFLLFFMDVLMAIQFQSFLSLKGPQHKDHVHVRYV